jgi:hypothetical protein
LGTESSFGDLASLALCLKLGLLTSQLSLQEIHLGDQILFNFARTKEAQVVSRVGLRRRKGKIRRRQKKRTPNQKERENKGQRLLTCNFSPKEATPAIKLAHEEDNSKRRKAGSNSLNTSSTRC